MDSNIVNKDKRKIQRATKRIQYYKSLKLMIPLPLKETAPDERQFDKNIKK